MSKYPISHNGSKKLGEFFRGIITFHTPPNGDKTILDPTCGKRHLWEDFFKSNGTGLECFGEVIFSDIKDYGQELVSDIKDLNFNNRFDCIVYDPPYFFGYKGSKDSRKDEYGGYSQSYMDLLRFMDIANTKFPEMLKPDGKLLVKCADQYNTKERRFYAHHYTWINRLSNFNLVDLYVFIHHRMSPTAFQVKNRPCSVIMHTYFLVFQNAR